MSIEFMNRVWKQSKQKGSKRLLLLAIADNTDDDGFAWPGMDYLAKKCNTTRQYIAKMVPELEESGELYCNHRKDDGHSNQYIILLGQTDQTVRDIFVKKMRISESEAIEVIEHLLEGVYTRGYTPEDEGVYTIGYTGCIPGVTPGVYQGLHEPSITPKEPPINIPAPKTKNGHSQLDPLTGIFQASVKGVSELTAPNPADQWLACSGTFAKAWQDVRGEVPNKQIRESMTILEQEAGADLAVWRLALVQCEENYPGHRASFVRVCEVYRAGGKYEDWKATLKQGEQNNGRQNGTSKKVIKREYEPVEREVFDLATGKVITVKS